MEKINYLSHLFMFIPTPNKYLLNTTIHQTLRESEELIKKKKKP